MEKGKGEGVRCRGARRAERKGRRRRRRERRDKRERFAHWCCQVLKLHPEVVELGGCEENHVESLYHERGKPEVVLCGEDLRQGAVDRVGVDVDTQLPVRGGKGEKKRRKGRRKEGKER